MAMNKHWSRLQPVILGRGTPEEGVLKVCKTQAGRASGPGRKNQCWEWEDDCDDDHERHGGRPRGHMGSCSRLASSGDRRAGAGRAAGSGGLVYKGAIWRRVCRICVQVGTTVVCSIGGHMTVQNKPWSKPQLIVLARGTPEEMVLTQCKGDSSGTGASSTNIGCYSFPLACSTCDRHTKS
jgi:hypothetical protein